MTEPVSMPAPAADQSRNSELYRVARELEGQFLSEMLKAAGFGKLPGAMGGGVGEEQFASFLTDEYASEMARAGGVGLAEALFAALVKEDGNV